MTALPYDVSPRPTIPAVVANAVSHDCGDNDGDECRKVQRFKHELLVPRGVDAHGLAKRLAVDAGAETSRFCQEYPFLHRLVSECCLSNVGALDKGSEVDGSHTCPFAGSIGIDREVGRGRGDHVQSPRNLRTAAALPQM